jgi:hypothetical protein
MGLSFVPFTGADLPLPMLELNRRHQQQEDYFLALIGAGAASQQAIEAEAGEGLGDRASAYLLLSDNKIYEMDNDAAGPDAGTIRGFVDGATLTGATARLVIGGLMDGFSGLTDFAAVFAGSTTGSITQTKPVPSLEGSQVAIAEMAFAVAADTVFVRPRPIQYQKRLALSDDETVTISHHPDERGYSRKIIAYYLESEAGASLATYASANQDSNVALSDRTVATYGADQCTGGTPLGNLTSSEGLAGIFDNNTATRGGRAATNGIAGYDFGLGVTKAIRKFTITAFTTPANSPKDFTIEHSDDNSNWTIASTVTGSTGWTSTQTRTFTFDAAGSHRYWRANITAVDGGSATTISEMEMMEAATYTDGATKLAQTFNLAGTETVGAVGLWLKKVGSPAGTVTVRIETVSASNPTGTLAHADATITFAEADLTTSYAEKVVTFGTAFSLGAADYAIVISTSRSPSEANYIHWGADGSAPAYAGGSMRSYAGSWAAASKDAVFTVYEEGLTHPQAIAVDWWTSTHADLVNRYGDGSGADLTTKTTFKCLRDSGFSDITLVVEVA